MHIKIFYYLGYFRRYTHVVAVENNRLSRCTLCRTVLATIFPSVFQSVKRVNCDKMNETSAEILIPDKRPIHLVFEQENGWWGRSHLHEILAKLTPSL